MIGKRMTNILRAYDFEALSTGLSPQGNNFVIVSGRTRQEYAADIQSWATRFPVYIRHVGAPGDREHAGIFKAQMIHWLGIQEFYEDDDVQINLIRRLAPQCKLFKVFNRDHVQQV